MVYAATNIFCVEDPVICDLIGCEYLVLEFDEYHLVADDKVSLIFLSKKASLSTKRYSYPSM
jgi:hypothetical protein